MNHLFLSNCQHYIRVATSRYVIERQAGIDPATCLNRRLRESAAAIAASHDDQLPKTWGRQVLEGLCQLQVAELKGRRYLEFGDHPFLKTDSGRVWQHLLKLMAESCLEVEEHL